jgi:multiple sugar transport system permease protein
MNDRPNYSSRRTDTASELAQFVILGLLIVFGLLMAAPFLWMLGTSLKAPAEIFQFPPRLIPDVPQWQNYAEVTRVLPFGRYFLNSFIVATSTTALQLVVCSMAAYAFARLRFPGRDLLFLAFLGALMVPSQVTLIPRFLLMRELGWFNTYQALILPFVFSSFGTFLLRQYFLTLPRELEEAARIDGASYFQNYWLIAMPLARPALAALAIFTFINEWNSFLWPLIVTTKPEMNTLIVGLNTLRGQYNTAWNLLMAGSVIAIVPILLVFALGNRYFIKGITTSGFGGR